MFFSTFVFIPSIRKAHAAGNTYYVNIDTGNDTTGDGSIGNPWKTCIKAETAAATGDTVHVATGIYVEASSVGGISGNITFTKGIAWIADGGNVTIRGKTASSMVTVAGNSNVSSWTGFVFDGQSAASQTLYIDINNANKTFTNCTIQGAINYQVRVKIGSSLVFTNCTFTHSGVSGTDAVEADDNGITYNNCIFNITGGYGIHSGATTATTTLNNCTFTHISPNSVSIYQTTAGPLVINNNTSITVTGGVSYTIRWGGNISLNDSTINSATSAGSVVYDSGANAAVSIINCNITYTMADASSKAILLSGGSLTIQASTLNITGGLAAIDSGSTNGSVTLIGNNITYSSAAAGTYLVYGHSTGVTDIEGNTINVPSGTSLYYLIQKDPGSRQVTGNLTFSTNVINVAIGYGSILYVSHCDCAVTINGNTITTTSTGTTGILINLYDIAAPFVTNNILTTNGTGGNTQIRVLPSDITHWTASGIATITGNTCYSHSQNSYVIELGEDSSSGVSYEQRWNQSIIAHNTIYGPAYFGDTASYNTHDILVGHNIKCLIYGNAIIGGSLGMVIKGNGGLDWQYTGGVYNNIFFNCTYAAILNKGSVNLNIFNNSIYTDAAHSHNYRYAIGLGEGIAQYPSTGCRIFNNIITTGNPLVYIIEADQYALTGLQAANNVYWDPNATVNTQMWSFNAAKVGLDAWKTAIGATENSIFADPQFVDAAGLDFHLQSTSPAIDAGIDVGLTADYLNHAIYGAPDIGAYEYQPPEVMGTNKIDIGAGARIYQDGSFRNLSTASGTSANLTITPQSGSFTVGNHALWMDIVIVIWNNTGIYHKSWTETSTVNGLNNTIHKVGDLAPNKYYNVKVDNVLGANMTGSYCTAGLCLADNNGIITFTYTGGYSTHTFDVTGVSASSTITATELPQTGSAPF